MKVIERRTMIEVLTSLEPASMDELETLRRLIEEAQALRAGSHHVDFALGAEKESFSSNPVMALTRSTGQFLHQLPETARKYFHGLIEALDIYESIHGSPLSAQSIRLKDGLTKELKQIREFCLQDGLHSML